MEQFAAQRQQILTIQLLLLVCKITYSVQDFAVKLQGSCRKTQAFLSTLGMSHHALTQWLPQPAPRMTPDCSLVPNGASAPAFLSPLFLVFSCPSTRKASSQNQDTAQMPEDKWHQTAHGINTPQERMTTSRSWSCLWSVLYPWPGLVCAQQTHARQ